MQEGTETEEESRITSEQALKLRVKQLEAEVQMLRRRQEMLDPQGLDAIGALNFLVGVEDGMAVVDPDWRLRQCNRNAELLVRRAAGTLQGKGLWDAFPELIGTETDWHLRGR